MKPIEMIMLKNYPLDSVYEQLENLTPLMFAAKYDCCDYIESKLRSLDENAKHRLLALGNVGGMTPLHFAARYGHLDAVQLLLSQGASPSILSTLDQLPIHSAFNQDNDKQTVTSIFNCLSGYRDTLSVKNFNGDTVAHLAAGLGLVDVLKTIESIDKTLLNKKNKQCMTPLLVAVLSNQLESTSYLLTAADKTITDNKGRNALHYAAIYSTNEMLVQLIPHFSIDQIDSERMTALQFAIKGDIKGSNLEQITTLLTAGAHNVEESAASAASLGATP